MPKSVLCLFAALLFVACGSTSSNSGGAPLETSTGDAIRVTWRDYRSGLMLELVSESHTDEADLYSAKSQTASTKVQEDLYMLALVDDFLSGEGFYDLARRGAAPEEGNGDAWHALEVDKNGELTHLTVGPRSTDDVVEVYNDCRRGFIELYNATSALQTVDNPDGAWYFEQQKSKLQR